MELGVKTIFSCTPDNDIWYFTLGKKILSYPCYLNQAVTWGLYNGCIGTHAHGSQVTLLLCESDIIISCRISTFRNFLVNLGAFFNYANAVFNGEQEKESTIHVGKIEKSVPQDHHLSSLRKPRDAKRWSSGQIFLSHPHTHDRFLHSFWIHCARRSTYCFTLLICESDWYVIPNYLFSHPITLQISSQITRSL